MGKQKIKNQIRRLRFDANEMTQEELAAIPRDEQLTLEAYSEIPRCDT